MLDFKGLPQAGSDRLNRKYTDHNLIDYFSVSPKILPVGEASTVCIELKEDYIALTGTYLLLIYPYYDYDYKPFTEQIADFIPVNAKDGKLTFTHTFEQEQLYLLIVAENTDSGPKILLRTSLYALEPDLYRLKPLIGDLHCHTIHSDGFESPESLLKAAIGCDLDFIAVTDHNNYEGSVYACQVAREKNLPITVLYGEEYSSTFTNMHIISLGASAALPGREYMYPESPENKDLSVARQTMLLCEKIHKNGGVTTLCHPLWKPLRRDRIRMDVPLSLVQELLENDAFDSVEVVGGSPEGDVMTTHMQYLLSHSYGATPDKVAYLGSTDSHTYSIDPICGKHFTMVFAEENSPQSILDAVRKRNTVAVQLIDSANALCFSTLRYSMFAQFYLKEVLHKIR